MPLGKDGEFWLTDAIQEFIRQGNQVVAQPIQEGCWFTTGDPLHLLEITLEYAPARQDIGAAVRELLQCY